MDIRVLRYFLAVAQEESITKAAESLHIAQPSLSKQMMELEKELSKQLLIRGSRKTALTEDGVLLRRRAEEIVELLDRTERELSAGTQTVSGEIAIGGGTNASILGTAAAIRARYPDVSFYFHGGDAVDVEERLDHGTLDFAVMLHPVDNVKYDCIPLPDEVQWGLLVKSGDPLAAEEHITRETLMRVPLILHRRQGLQWRIAAWAQTDVEKLNIAATYNVINGNPEAFVKSGIGAFLTVRELLSSRIDDGVCFRPLYPALTERHMLVWKRRAALSRAARVFLDAARASVEA